MAIPRKTTAKKAAVPGSKKQATKQAAKATKKSSPAKSAALKKSATPKKAADKDAATPKQGSKAEPSRDRKTRDPKGGLTPAGREYFAKTEGSKLKPGVKGPADTPEKKKRKGSFLRRHFAHPRGPMEKQGEPTRLALSAQAWGEPVPTTATDARKLAAKGKQLLTEYQAGKPVGSGK